MDCCTEVINLCINQGATFSKLFTWFGPQFVCGQLQQLPVNITGYTAVLQIRPFVLSTSILYDASGNLTLGGAAGTILLSIPAGSTEGFTWWQGVYDLLLTSSDGSYSVRLFQGKVTVSPGVSQ